MKRHALPQNIMDVEFKLFGALTLKQFVNLAVNVVIALIIYSTPIPSIVKWPIIVMFVMLGLALALVTVNGLPFSAWLSNFLEALTTSQRRVWKKSQKRPEILKGNYKPKGKYTTHLVSRATKANNFDMPLLDEEAKQAADKSDREEAQRMSTIDMHLKQNFDKKDIEFDKTQAEKLTNIQEPIQIPKVINHNEQKLAMDVGLNDTNVVGIQTGENTTITMKKDSSGRVKDKEYYRNLISGKTQIPDPSKNSVVTPNPVQINSVVDKSLDFDQFDPKIVKQNQQIEFMQKQIKILQDQLSTLQKSQDNFDNQSNIAKKIDQINQEIVSIKTPTPQNTALNPANSVVPVEKQNPIKPEVEEKVVETTKTSEPIQSSTITKQQTEPKSGQKANMISGYVIDKLDKPIEGASIEIKDAQGFPLRKTYTDKNGYFTFRTPLANGKYVMDFDKPGRHFVDYNLVLNGKILPVYKFKER